MLTTPGVQARKSSFLTHYSITGSRANSRKYSDRGEWERKEKAKMNWVSGHTQEATCLGLSGGVAARARRGLQEALWNESWHVQTAGKQDNGTEWVKINCRPSPSEGLSSTSHHKQSVKGSRTLDEWCHRRVTYAEQRLYFKRIEEIKEITVIKSGC